MRQNMMRRCSLESMAAITDKTGCHGNIMNTSGHSGNSAVLHTAVTYVPSDSVDQVI